MTGCLNGLSDLVANTPNRRPKCIEDSSMNTNIIMSIAGESKYATEEFLVLNPPVATVLKEWFTASKKDIPASMSNNVSSTASPTYTKAMTCTVFMERNR